jgi:hypothetical protein
MTDHTLHLIDTVLRSLIPLWIVLGLLLAYLTIKGIWLVMRDDNLKGNDE